MTRFARPAAVALTAAALVVGPIAVTTPAYAASFAVTITADSGLGSLRDAIDDANANPGADVVVFDGSLGGQTIELDSVIIITETLTISGPGSDQLTIARSGPILMDLLAFQPDTVDQDLTITGLSLQGDGTTFGSGIIVNDNVETPRNVELEDLAITDMAVGINGAGMNVNNISGSITITDSVFSRNTSGQNGGAVSAINVGQVSIVDSQFSDNQATLSGGAVALNGATGVTVEGSVFTGNTAVDFGGGVVLSTNGALVVESSTFESNEAENGGGLYAAALTVSSRISDSIFTDNDGFLGGGGVYIQEALADVIVERTTFEANRAASLALAVDGGGGLYVGGISGGSTLTVDSSTFTGHEVFPGLFGFGSGLSLAVSEVGDGSAVRIINSTMSETAQETVAAVNVGSPQGGSSTTIEHSTIVAENVFRIDGGDESVTVRNSILVSGAVAGGGTLVGSTGEPVTLSWTLTSGSILPAAIIDAGNNKLSVDPQLGPLADNGGPTQTHLPAPNSPALNAGDPDIIGEPTFDQRGIGFDRVLQGRIDMGAVEANDELAATGAEAVPGLLAGGLALLVLGVLALLPRRRRA